jgi:hypothetical protein
MTAGIDRYPVFVQEGLIDQDLTILVGVSKLYSRVTACRNSDCR